MVAGAFYDDDLGDSSGSTYLFALIEDMDGDGEPDETDNCPATPNPAQADVDGDGAGDLCDLCPSDPSQGCHEAGSTAEEVSVDSGGTVATPDGSLTVEVEVGDLVEDATLSVTQAAVYDPLTALALSTGEALGEAVAVYDLQPDGLAFSQPVTLTIVADVSLLDSAQRDNLSLYYDDGSGPMTPVAGASCSVAEDPPDTFIATCTAELEHFSIYALVAPLDSDGDGIFDLFNGIEDICLEGPNVLNGFLSPLAELVPVEVSAAPTPGKAFKAGRTLPLKLAYFCGPVPVTDQSVVSPPRILELWRTGDAEPLDVVDADSGAANDNGVFFRYSEDHWIYNFTTRGLPQGTYEIVIKLPDGRNFKGGFVLR